MSGYAVKDVITSYHECPWVKIGIVYKLIELIYPNKNIIRGTKINTLSNKGFNNSQNFIIIIIRILVNFIRSSISLQTHTFNRLVDCT